MIQSHAPRRSRFHLLALTSVLGLAARGLSQCRNVTDQLTAVDLNTPHTLSARTSCARKCNTAFKAELLAEEARYVAAKRACGHNFSCRKDEDRTHAMNLRELLNRKRRCKRSCYNEGAGNAGA
jgi:hypothetical protein